jgi:UDP-glucose 4-epimerase
VKGDISNRALLENEISKSDVVYHMAGIADIGEANENPLDTISENIMGSSIIMSLCAKHSVRFMYGSTVYVYSKHGSFYRASKQSVETLIDVFHENCGLDYTILRYGSLYGPRSQSWNGLKRIVSEIIANKKILFGGTGKEKREYIHVVDAAKMSADLLDDAYLQKAVTLTGLQVLTQAELLEMIVEILDVEVSIDFDANSKSHSHYNLTPYQYVPKSSTKLVSKEYIDIGQGVLELISELSSDNEV